MPHPTSPPSGPRASRSSQSASSTRRPNRGGIQKRTGPIRTDKDGDLVMAASASVGRGSNGRSGGGRGTTQMRTNGRSGPRFETTERRAAKSALNLPLMQKAILQEMGAGKLVTRGSRSSQRIASVLDIITIKGLKQSKAASNQDGGVKDLVAFLERKATAPDASTREMVRIRKVCLILQFTGPQRPCNSGLSGPLSFQAKPSERRPRYPSLAATALG